MADEEQPAEGVSFDPYGHVTFDFGDGDLYRLRRPRLREFRELQEALIRVERHLQSDQEKVAAISEKIAAAETAAERQELRAEFDAIPIAAWTYFLPWLVDAFSLLGDPAPELDPEEWPAWVGNGRLPGEILAHFMRHPLRSGAKGTNSPPRTASG